MREKEVDGEKLRRREGAEGERETRRKRSGW
jgi:hypothetical protein